VSHRRTTFQNIAWLVVERIARVGMAVVVISFVARHLGPAGFGTLNFALVLLGLAMPLATLCFDAAIVGDLVRRPEATPAVLGGAFVLRLGGGIASAALLFAIGQFQFLEVEWSIQVPVALMLVLQAGEVPELWFQSQLLARRTVIARVIALLLGAALKLELVRRDATAVSFVWAQAAENALYVAALMANYHFSAEKAKRWCWPREELRRLAHLGWPLAVAGLLVALYLRLDQMLVQRWLSPTEAGVYFAAARLIDVATLGAAAVGTSVFPALAAAHGSTLAQFDARLRAVFDLLSGLGWIVALGLTFTAPWLVRLIFGPAYAAAVPILIVKAWTCVVLFSGIARGHFVVLTGATRANLAAVIVGIAVQAIGAVLLIPRLGALGAAFAAAVAALVSGWLTSFILPALRPCAVAQTRGLLIAFQPGQWAACRKLLS